MSTEPRPRAYLPWLIALVAGVVSLALAGSLVAVTPSRASVANVSNPVDTPSLGCGTAEVTRTLASGSAWRMCAHIHPYKGLVLEQVQFRPATGDREYAGWLPVVDSLYLSQLVVPYDTGAAAFNDVTAYGFGNYQLLAQSERTCPGETMAVEQSFLHGNQLVERTIPGICLDEVGTGLGWNSQESNEADAERYTHQGRALEVSSITKISWYEYQQKVTLTDQGTITVGLGATGDLAPLSLFFPEDPAAGWSIGPGSETPPGHASSHWHNAVYRVDFGIDSGAQQVQQWDYSQPDPQAPARVEGTGAIRTEAFAADAEKDPQTWWRVLNPTSLNPDGHARSYEIVNDSVQNPYDPLTRPQVSFTNDHACQEYASDNLNAGCPGQSVPDYVAAETEPLTDPVAWVNVGFHHVARDEDQSPMPAHWQEFSLVPRDLLAQQATTPVERTCVNGGPVELFGSCAAVALTPPQITASTPGVKPTTVLTGTLGTWRIARAPLSHERLWLRDGQPISTTGPDGLPVSATGERYTVTNADRGHRISLRVLASGPGITPGSATSQPIAVPAATAPPTATPAPAPVLVTPRLRATLQQRARPPRLQVRVAGAAGPATGRVVVRGAGWKRTLTLRNGRARVLVPRALLRRTTRLVLRYPGDDSYRAVRRTVRVAPVGR